jgi:hypothetical protein
MEEWKLIPDFEYEISSFGRVKNKLGNILKERICTSGRPQASLSKNGKQYQFFNHVLVAKAFIPNFENKPQIDHIDRDRTNNNVSNLRWVTQTENQQNTIKRKQNTSGYKCVFKYPSKQNRWFSSFMFNYKIYTSKAFDTKEEAYEWYTARLSSLQQQVEQV